MKEKIKGSHQLKQLLSQAIALPEQPICRGKVLEVCKDIQVVEFVPVTAELDSIMEIAIFGDQAKLEPPSTADCFFAGVIINISSTNLHPHFSGSEFSIIVHIAKIDPCLPFIFWI